MQPAQEHGPRANAVLVEALSGGIRSTGNGLADIPDLLKRVLQDGAWRSFTTPRGKLVEHARFIDFVTTPPSEGLGTTIALIQRIVGEDMEALDLLDQVLKRGPGERVDPIPDATVYNVNGEQRPMGHSRAYALRRLRDGAPDLHARVIAGELTANAAMIQAGFRERTVSVPISRPDTVARTLRKHLTPEALSELVDLLKEAD